MVAINELCDCTEGLLHPEEIVPLRPIYEYSNGETGV